MRQTLIFISPDFLTPALVIWLLVGAVTLAVIAYRKGFEKDFWGTLPMVLVGGLVIWFLIPAIMVRDPDTNELLGVPIRGYGLFLLLGVSAGVTCAVYRAYKLGLHPDVTINLCFWLFGCGIVGARLFYVFQYRQEFDSLAGIINMTKGGLVVYGSIFGGLAAAIGFAIWRQLPVLLVLDIIAPCMMIGLTLGRIGCLMNGCCYGGICESDLPQITFPEGVAPYARHVETGELFGMKAPPATAEGESREILEVDPESPAAKRGIQSGDRIVDFSYPANPNDRQLPDQIAYRIQSAGNEQKAVFRKVEFSGDEIPERSLPVHPAQIYSAINALFVFFFLWTYFPFRTRDGQVIGLLMIIYPIARSLLEAVRSDELGQFGTDLTIAQYTSICTVIAGVAVIVYGFARGHKTELLVSDDASG